MSRSQEAVHTAEVMPCSPLQADRSFLGLNEVLWRLAIVTGISQLSVSIWVWQFAISLDAYLLPWQIGLTFAAGSLASLLGYPISGFVADLIGRKKTLAVSFIPQTFGMVLLFLLPVWPIVLVGYGLHSFGWAFVLVISRAMPTDEIGKMRSPQAARKMTMVLLPSFIVDGVSPIIAVALLQMGLNIHFLLLLGAGTAGVSGLLSIVFVRETLDDKVKELGNESRGGLASFGRKFWEFTLAMVGYYIAWGMAIPYLGILSVQEWGVSLETFGATSSAFSLASVLMMHTLSGIAGRRVKRSLVLSLSGNSVIMAVLGLGSETWLLILLNVIWAVPIIVWIATESILSIEGVPAHLKGRALGVFHLVISATALVAAPIGALIWEWTGSVRFLWVASGLLAIGFTVSVWWIFKRVGLQSKVGSAVPESDSHEICA